MEVFVNLSRTVSPGVMALAMLLSSAASSVEIPAFPWARGGRLRRAGRGGRVLFVANLDRSVHGCTHIEEYLDDLAASEGGKGNERTGA